MTNDFFYSLYCAIGSSHSSSWAKLEEEKTTKQAEAAASLESRAKWGRAAAGAIRVLHVVVVLAVIAVRVFAATDVLSEGYIHRDDGGRGAIPLHASCQSLHQLTDIIVRCQGAAVTVAQCKSTTTFSSTQ